MANTKSSLLARIQSGEVAASQIRDHLQIDMSRFRVKHQSLLEDIRKQDPTAMSRLLALVCDVPEEVVDEIPMTDFIPLANQIANDLQEAVGVSRTGKN